MDIGFVLDRAVLQPATWMEGPIDITWLGGLDMYERKHAWLRSYRCPKCWYVETYAPPA